MKLSQLDRHPDAGFDHYAPSVENGVRIQTPRRVLVLSKSAKQLNEDQRVREMFHEHYRITPDWFALPTHLRTGPAREELYTLRHEAGLPVFHPDDAVTQN